MKIEELKNESFTKELQIQIPFGEINDKVEEQVLEAAKSFKMPGFREGKVPLSIVRQKVGKEKSRRQIQDTISSIIKSIVEAENIMLYSKPGVEILAFDEDSGLLVKIHFEILPEVPVITWEDIEINKVNIKISEQEINKAKNNLFKEFRRLKKSPENYSAKLGDKVKINFDGKIDGKDFDGNKAKDMELIIGDNTFFTDFEMQLIGCKLDEEKTFKVVFPASYPKEEIANKESEFTVKIISLEELEPITKISDDMLKKVGVESEKKLNDLIKQKIESDLMSTVRLKMKKDIFDIVDQKYKFDLPEKMVKQDLDEILKQMKGNKDQLRKFKDKSEAAIKDECRIMAERRVRVGLIMAEVTKKNNISITNEELDRIVTSQAKQNLKIKDKILEFYKDPKNLEKIKRPILEEKVFDFILSKVKLKNIKMTTEDFVKSFNL